MQASQLPWREPSRGFKFDLSALKGVNIDKIAEDFKVRLQSLNLIATQAGTVTRLANSVSSWPEAGASRVLNTSWQRGELYLDFELLQSSAASLHDSTNSVNPSTCGCIPCEGKSFEVSCSSGRNQSFWPSKAIRVYTMSCCMLGTWSHVALLFR